MFLSPWISRKDPERQPISQVRAPSNTEPGTCGQENCREGGVVETHAGQRPSRALLPKSLEARAVQLNDNPLEAGSDLDRQLILLFYRNNKRSLSRE